MGSVRRIAVILTGLGACALPVYLWAQSVTPAEIERAARQAEQLQRNQQQLEEQRQAERDRLRQRPAGALLPPQPAPEEGTEPPAKCITVRSVELVGARHLPADVVDPIRASAVGRCLGTADLNALLRAITGAYVSRGLITSRAYLPAQDTSKGKLTIVVVEGTVERVDVSPPGTASTATAFPHVVGEVLNLRQLEQGIDQLNRLSSNNASLDVQPGSTPGSSVIVVANPARRRLMGSFSADDTGSAATGEWLGTATVLVDDPLALNDGLVLSHSRSLDDPAGPPMSRSTSVSYFIPYGWLTGNLLYSESAYGSVVPGVTRNFTSRGTTRTTTLRADYVAYRDQTRKLTLYGGLTRRDSENFIADQLIEASSRNLVSLTTSANLSVLLGGSLWTFDFGVARGLAWLGGLSDPGDLPGNAPRAQFTKISTGAGVARGFETFGVRTQLSSTLATQWSNDVLYSSEQMAIAGPFSVRGYRDGRLFGDRGMTWRNELAFPVSFGALANIGLAIRPFVGADYGKVWAHGSVPGAYLSGWAAGTNLAWSSVNAQLSWSGSAWRSQPVAPDHMFFARFTASF
jgi:hemolysin activation/secretion protein